MSDGATIGVGIVGLGFGARVHLPGFRRLEAEGVQVAALCARDSARAERIAREAGVPRAYGDWRELVADPAVRLVSIASPPATHREIALAALERGKAVLCEKPLAVTLAQAEELAAGAERAGVPTLVDFEFRAVPAFRRARELLTERAIGRVLQLEIAWHLPSRLRAKAGAGWKEAAREGGGALLSLGVHSFDYVEWLLGPVASLCGSVSSTLGSGGSDDACAALLRLADGTPVTLSISTVAAAGRGHVLELFGERGQLVLANGDASDYMRAFTLAVNGERQALPEPEPEPVDGRLPPFTELAGELVRAVREGRRATPSFADGLRAQRLADAVLGSQRAWVTV